MSCCITEEMPRSLSSRLKCTARIWQAMDDVESVRNLGFNRLQIVEVQNEVLNDTTFQETKTDHTSTMCVCSTTCLQEKNGLNYMYTY